MCTNDTNNIALTELQSLIESTKDILFILNTEERHTYIGGSWMNESPGFKASDFLGQRAVDMFGEEKGEVHHQANQKILAGEDYVTYEWEIESPEGLSYMRTSLTPIYGDNEKKNDIIGIAGIGRDITQQKESRQTLKTALKELKERNAELKTFVSVANHDLAQPLHTVLGYLELFKAEYGDDIPEKGLEYLNTIKSIIVRQGEYIEDLLNYSKIGMKKPSFQTVDLNRIVQEAQQNLTADIEEENAQIKVKQLPKARVNENLLVLVFQNLISNALKFRQDDTRLVIEIDSEYCSPVNKKNKNDYICIYVKDNGSGLDPKERDRVFNLFERVSNHQEGTGAGLALTKKIIDLHHGTIWYELNEDQPGTTFYFTLREDLVDKSNP